MEAHFNITTAYEVIVCKKKFVDRWHEKKKQRKAYSTGLKSIFDEPADMRNLSISHLCEHNQFVIYINIEFIVLCNVIPCIIWKSYTFESEPFMLVLIYFFSTFFLASMKIIP